jgi:dihydrolipoamide dehydrogenase
MPETFDILVIGAGPGGHAAAIRAARLGARAAIIERQGWGGTCTHRGCIPTKALLACSRRYAELKKLGRMGVRVAEPSFDFAAMKRYQEQIVKISALGVEKSLKDGGVEMKSGEGRIISPGEVEWTAPDGRRERLSARNLVIAWGSEPALPPGVQPAERILTSDGLLSMRTLPGNMLIVGGNVIGVEFATLMAELGVRVTLIEMMEQILPGEEREAAALLAQELKNLGVAVHTGVRMETLQETDSRVELIAANITARTALLGPGFVKLLFDRDRLTGATIAGEQAGELIASLSLAMAAGIDRRQLEEWIIPHPTLSEVLGL